jgi:DNA-binding NarL/FixJ family response regulator
MIRVLVVDDEALIRTGFEHILNSADGIDVVAAVPGSRAVHAVRELCPEVVLLDIRMPDVDGLTVLAELRGLPRPPVVAMLTTFDMDEYVAAGSSSRTPTRHTCRISYARWRRAGSCCRPG